MKTIWRFFLNTFLASTLFLYFHQVCHIVLGLKPSSRAEEGEIVLGWLRRAEAKSLTIGQFWYIINMEWWGLWHDYVSHQVMSTTFMWKFSLFFSLMICSVIINETFLHNFITVFLSYSHQVLRAVPWAHHHTAVHLPTHSAAHWNVQNYRKSLLTQREPLLLMLTG